MSETKPNSPRNSGTSSEPEGLDALRRRIGAFEEERLGELAVERGWLTEEGLECCLELIENGSSPLALSALLVERGLLTQSRIEELRALLPQVEAQERIGRQLNPAPPEVLEAQNDPDTRFGKFVLVRELGRGGVGIVYRAWQSDLGRWVAVKRLKGDSPRMLERFLREGRFAAQVVHPNLVPIYEVGEIGGDPYLAMAILEGGSLERKRLPIRQAVEIAMAVAFASHELHNAGIVHRDIKPGNVLLDKSGRAYLGDFSLACTEESAPGLSKSGMLVGTPAYAAPEQIRGQRRKVSPRSDVYSLGATLYELLTGDPPFLGKDSFDVVKKALWEDPPSVRSKRPEINHQIEIIILKAMRKDSGERYASALEFAADLKRYLDGETVLARPPGFATRLRGAAVRHRKALAACAILASLALAAGAFGLWRKSADREKESERKIEETAAQQRADRFLDQAGLLLDEADQFLARGPAAADDLHKKVDAAEKEIAEALALHPGSPRAHLLQGKVHWRRGSLDEAERELAETVRLAPADRRARYDLARLRVEKALLLLLVNSPRPIQVPCCAGTRRGNVTIPGVEWKSKETWTAALDLYDRAKSDLERLADDSTPFARRGLVDAYEKLLQRKFTDAARICEYEDKANPQREFSLILGLCRILDGDRDPVLLEKLIDKDPSYALAHLAIAEVRPPRLAVEDCSRAIALQPKLAVAWANRGAYRLEMGESEKAIRDLDRALELQSGLPQATDLRTLARLMGGETQRAGEEVGALPVSARSLWLKTLVLLQDRRHASEGEAIELLTQALSLDADHAPSLLLRCHLYKQRGKLEHALQDAEQLVRDDRAPAYWNGFRGEILLQLGRNFDAKEAFERALRNFEFSSWFVQRGVARRKLGDRDGAREDLETAVRLDSKDAAAHYYRGMLRGEKKDWKGAREDLEEARRLDPSLSADVDQLLKTIPE